jgi:hypothetical protein
VQPSTKRVLSKPVQRWRRRRGRGSYQGLRKVVLWVPHQCTAWFARHLWDSRAVLHKSNGAIAQHISSSTSNSSSTLVLPLHHSTQHSSNLRSYLDQQNTRDSAAGKASTSLRVVARSNRQVTKSCGTCVKPTKGPTPWTGRANYTTMEEMPTREEVLTGTFFLHDHHIIILFDSRASHDFMSSMCAKKAKLSLVAMEMPYMNSTPRG